MGKCGGGVGLQDLELLLSLPKVVLNEEHVPLFYASTFVQLLAGVPQNLIPQVLILGARSPYDTPVEG